MLQAILFVGTIFTRLYLIFSISALPGVILSLIVIWLIGKLIKNDNIVKRLIYVIIVAFCIYISMNIFFKSPYALKVMDIISKIGEFEKTDNLYIKINEINDIKIL